MSKASIQGTVIDHKENGAYIVLEAGPTHTGIESAKEMAKVAKEAGADAIKFQLLYADRLLADKTIAFGYKYLEIDADGTETFVPFEEPLYDILKRRELTKEEWIELKAYCDEIGITMFTTATYEDEVDFVVDELKIDSIKLNSSDINELEFIRYCAKKGVNIQVDTGNADIWEIERAIIVAEEAGCDNIIIHHCPSGYPAHLESIHLNMITTLKRMFPNYAVGFSDHSPGWTMDIGAVAIGADLVEKTMTFDRTTKSCEHSFSLEPDDVKAFIKDIRELEVAMGDSRRILPTDVKSKRKLGRRSPYALRDLKAGEEIRDEDFEFKRPGYGLNRSEFNMRLGDKLDKNLSKGDLLD